ncbi:CBS domain-containing protein [Streptosporangium sp. NPDC004379]|uniref:CBS domain-containing protein n=1 Tax=Streptosporangium sp. NPDC004379 TaxID=3366189 RepID=UPI0036B7F5E2
MTRKVVSVREDACFKQIAAVFVAHAVGAVPVLDGEGRVTGVVSASDLLREEPEGPPGTAPGDGVRRPSRCDLARRLMSSPAITVPEAATLADACRLMRDHHVRRLPVVDRLGRLVGIVSRRDLLKPFVRPDRDIEREIRQDVLTRSLWMDTSRVRVSVRNGMATLSGTMTLRGDTRTALTMTLRVDGVVGVIDDLLWERDNVPVRQGF